MGDWRWIAKDGFEYFGDEAKLREALGKKEVGLSTLVWPDGATEGDGVPLGTTPEFAPPKTMPLASATPFAENANPFYQPEPESPTEVDNAAPVPADEPEPEPVVAAPPPARPHFQPSAPPNVAYRSAPAPSGSKSIGILFAIGVFVIGSVVVVGVLLALGVFKSTPPKPSAASATPSASAAARETPKNLLARCQAETPKRLSESALGRVPLDAIEAGNRLGIAFAENEHTARALSLDLQSLAAEPRDPVKSKPSIVSVTAWASGSNVELSVDVADRELKSSKTVLGSPGFRIGSTPEGIATRRGDQTSVVWPSTKDAITVPRIESIAGVGHFVSFRRGAKELAAGWLDVDGKRKTELETIRFDARALGTPSVTAGPDGVLLLVAARTTSPNWIIAAARAKSGSVPKELSVLPIGDMDAPSISPSAAPLPHDQWIIQWTTGHADSHVVHAAVFDADLKRTTDPIAISASGTDAGQGVIWSNGTRIVSFFLVSTGKTHELWAAGVKCE